MPDPRHHVLFVEDDRFLQKILATKFAKEGFDVDAASDAEEALGMLRDKTPDIVLLDLILPGMSGFDMLSAIRANRAYDNLPVIVLSNLAQDEDRQRAMTLGAAEFLVKADVSINEIVRRVREAYVRHLQKVA